jgi:hypothetical protein
MFLPRGTARGKDYVLAIGHWVGQKVTFNWNIAESVAIWTLGLKVTRFTLNEFYRAERCRDLAEEYRLVAATCTSTETRDHYSRMSEHSRTRIRTLTDERRRSVTSPQWRRSSL